MHERPAHIRRYGGEEARSYDSVHFCLDGGKRWEGNITRQRARILARFYQRIRGETRIFRALTASDEASRALGDISRDSTDFPASGINANFDVGSGTREDVAVVGSYCGMSAKRYGKAADGGGKKKAGTMRPTPLPSFPLFPGGVKAGSGIFVFITALGSDWSWCWWGRRKVTRMMRSSTRSYRGSI